MIGIKQNNVTKVMGVSIFTNLFLSIFKIISGFLFKSSSLIADGMHSLSDLITDFFAIIGNLIARKPADYEHPYGHGKIEYLTSLVIGFIILIVGFSVIYSSVNKDVVIANKIVVVVSLITIILKYLLSNYIIKKGIKYKNNILIASGKESKTDIISSLVVLVSSILIQFSNSIEILKYSDIVASIIVGIFILNVGFSVIKENISIILGEQETNSIYLEKLKNLIKKNDGIIDISKCIVLKFGYAYNLSLTILMDSNLTFLKAHEIVDEIEKKIKEFDEHIVYINTHMEPYIEE